MTRPLQRAAAPLAVPTAAAALAVWLHSLDRDPILYCMTPGAVYYLLDRPARPESR